MLSLILINKIVAIDIAVQSCLTLCASLDCSMPLHHFPELAQTHVP